MIAGRRTAPRRPGMLVLLAVTALAATGCSVTNSGNCNAIGGKNSVSCTGSAGSGSAGSSSGDSSSGDSSSGDSSSGGSSSGGSGAPLFSVAQTPGNRQGAGTLTYNGQAYAKSFQLDLPWGSSASYAYALNAQWSTFKFVVGIPKGGNGAANIGVEISLDGQPAGNQYIVQGNPYSGQFSVTGVKTLTISFNTEATLSATAVLVAANLYH